MIVAKTKTEEQLQSDAAAIAVLIVGTQIDQRQALFRYVAAELRMYTQGYTSRLMLDIAERS